MPLKNEIVDAGIDDEAIEVQRPSCCCGRTWTDQAGDRTPCRIFDMSSIELGVMRAWSTWNRWKTLDKRTKTRLLR